MSRIRWLALLAVLAAAVVAALSVGVAAGSAGGLCASYSGYTNTSSTATVSFTVVSTPCQVSLISYQSNPGPVYSNVVDVTQTFTTTGAHSLTVAVTCGTNNQVDLYLGPPQQPIIPAGVDLAALSLTPSCQSVGVLTQGYWKNHPAAWPLSSLTLGGRAYSEAQAIAILQTPPAGDATLILAHQLIAAELNVAAGATASCITTTIAAANALLSSYRVGSGLSPSTPAGQIATSLANTLDHYNSGQLCAAAG